MKANVKGNVFVTKDVVKAEIKKYTKEHYNTIAADVAVLFAALVLCVLDRTTAGGKRGCVLSQSILRNSLRLLIWVRYSAISLTPGRAWST